MDKPKLGMIDLVPEDREEIGGVCYCLYCGNKVIEHQHYHDGGFEGTSHECDCRGANEAEEIRNKLRAFNARLNSLKDDPKVEKVLNLLRYQSVVQIAAIQFKQP